MLLELGNLGRIITRGNRLAWLYNTYNIASYVFEIYFVKTFKMFSYVSLC